MSKSKLIPTITLPDYPEDSPVHFVIGSHILFVGVHRDDTPTNPLEDCDGIGSIDAIDCRRHSGIKTEIALDRLWHDADVIPLRFRDWGAECAWSVSEYADDAHTNITVARNTAILLNRDMDEVLDNFDPEWINKIDGIWTPDKYVRESYTGQDGLTRREWMKKQAEAACESYTDYCNGNVYGFDIRLYKVRKDSDGVPFDDIDDYRRDKEVAEDSCWGFYGWDYFLDEVKDRIKSIMKNDLKISRRAIAAAFKEEVAA